MALLALLALVLSGLNLTAVALGAAAILLGTAHAWYHRPWRSLEVREQGRVLLRHERGHRVSGSLTGNPFVSPFFIGFGFRGDSGARYRVGLFPDELAREDYRRLAARLRNP